MPGTFTVVYIVAFDLDDRSQAVPAFTPRVAASEAAAIEEAGELARRHAGVIVWRRANDPVSERKAIPRSYLV